MPSEPIHRPPPQLAGDSTDRQIGGGEGRRRRSSHGRGRDRARARARTRAVASAPPCWHTHPMHVARSLPLGFVRERERGVYLKP